MFTTNFMFKIELQTLRKKIRYDVILLTIMYTTILPWSVLSDPWMKTLNSPEKKKNQLKKTHWQVYSMSQFKIKIHP